MERYFLGNNTAYGFKGYYESELLSKRRVILLKGGPGTGKSSILKKLADEGRKRGMDYELWYCSGDPKSLDGVFIKDVDTAIVDATSPHATAADSPKMKDFIFDLASSLNHDKLMKDKDMIDKLLNRKKLCFIRINQHLKTAFCHYNNVLALEKIGFKESDLRLYAALVASKIKEGLTVTPLRNVFTTAICPSGESVFYDHLKDKKVYKVSGNTLSRRVFFDELCGLLSGGTRILNPLDPTAVNGIVIGDVALVDDPGKTDLSGTLDLTCYFKDVADDRWITEELNLMNTEIAFAVECLNEARACHLGAEKYFISAMDFTNNDRMYKDMLNLIFG